MLHISTPFTAVRCSQISVLIMASTYRFAVIFRLETFRRIMTVSSETIGGKRCKCLCVILLRENAEWNVLFGTHCGLRHHYALHPVTYHTTSLRPAPIHLPDHIFTPCIQPPTTPHHYAMHPTTYQTTSLHPAPNHLPHHIITPCSQSPTTPCT